MIWLKLSRLVRDLEAFLASKERPSRSARERANADLTEGLELATRLVKGGVYGIAPLRNRLIDMEWKLR
jgi:hypothetical protein